MRVFEFDSGRNWVRVDLLPPLPARPGIWRMTAKANGRALKAETAKLGGDVLVTFVPSQIGKHGRVEIERGGWVGGFVVLRKRWGIGKGRGAHPPVAVQLRSEAALCLHHAPRGPPRLHLQATCASWSSRSGEAQGCLWAQQNVVLAAARSTYCRTPLVAAATLH